MHKLKIKRVYEQVEESDGFRILTDRIWPRRQLSKDAACLEEVGKGHRSHSCSSGIWFAHKEENFESFKKQYDAELSANPAAVCLPDIATSCCRSRRHLALWGAF